MINLFTADSYFKLFDILSEELKGKTANIEDKNIIFCEDKISLMVERRICSDYNGSFNTSVYSFGSYLRSKKSFDKLLSKEGSTMVIKNILDETPLKRYNNNSINLASSFYELIIQLKSAKVNPVDLEYAYNNSVGILKEKLLDMHAVYDKYQKVIQESGYEDQSSVLSYLPDIIENSDEIANANVFVFGFESFTAQARSVLSTLIKKAKSFTAILVSGENQFAFLNECEDCVKKIAKEQGKDIINQKISSGYNALSKKIVEGLFNPYKYFEKQTPSSDVYVSSSHSVYEEAERVAEIIRQSVLNGEIRYREATVIFPENQGYKEAFYSAFGKLDIPYFFDEKKKALNHPIVKLILSYSDLFISGFNRKHLIEFVKNPIISNDKDLTDKFEDYLTVNNINFGKIKNPFTVKSVDDLLFDKLENFRKYIISLTEIFDVRALLKQTSALKKGESFSKTLEEYSENDQSAVNSQIYQKVSKILDEIEMIMGTNGLEPSEFKKIFYSGISAMEISIIPQYNDAVFIGNFKEGALCKAKYLFVVGLDSSVPTVEQDISLLSDDDIKTLSNIKILVEPEIRIINKRAKEQTLLGLSAFSDRLYVSYPTVDSEGKMLIKSEIIGFLSKKFTVKPFPKSAPYLSYKQGLNNFANECSDFVNGVIDEMPFATSFYNLDKTGKAKSILDHANSELKVRLNNENGNLLSGVSSPTALEKYAECPYKFFVNFTLKVNDKKKGEASSDIVGILVHEIFKRYFTDIDKVTDEQSSDKLVEDILCQIKSEGDFNEFTDNAVEQSKINDAVRQAKKFCYKNYLWLTNSDFTVKKENLESEFGVGKRFNPIELLNGKIKLKGMIDRIDTSDNMFRVIDYKTGKYDESEGALYSGRKLQLYLYSLAVANSFENGEDAFVGAYYCPIGDDYVNDGDKKKTVDSALVFGRSVSDEDVLKRNDKNYTVENGSKVLNVNGGLVSREGMKAYLRYSKLISEKMAKYMDEGLIIPSAYGSGCDDCEFKSMCMTTLDKREVSKVSGDVIVNAVANEEKSEE